VIIEIFCIGVLVLHNTLQATSLPPEARTPGFCVPDRYLVYPYLYVCLMCSSTSYRVKCISFWKRLLENLFSLWWKQILCHIAISTKWFITTSYY